MRIKKLWLATIAALWCSLSASAHDFEVGGIYYKITSPTDLTVAVTYSGVHHTSVSDEYYGAVAIPDTVTYNSETYSVTSIEQNAFCSCRYLTSITIPASVTSIGEDTFVGCSSLTTIIVADGNPIFDSRDGCNAIIGTKSNTLIQGCNSSTIPEGVTSIGDGAFSNFSNLTSITIPEGVTSIDDWAFHNCSNLTSITIPASVTSIGYRAFYYCSNLTEITIPENSQLTSIGYEAFGGVKAWYNNQPDGVIYIGKVLYKYKGTMPANTSIEVKEGTKGIAASAFSGCSGLTSISIPASVTSIGDRALSGTAWFNNQPDGVVYIGKVLYSYKGTMPENTSIEVKDGTTGITDNAFYGCTNLTSITIPSSVTSIGAHAFYGCSSLTAITTPEGVTRIERATFSGCSSLTIITIPASVTSIKYHAFLGCSSLTSITIPASVTSIGFLAFSGCSGLTSITIPEGVTSIGSSAFSGCSSLKTVISYSDLILQKGSSSNGYVGYYAESVINIDKTEVDADGYLFKTIDGVPCLIGYFGDDTELTLPDTYKGENYRIVESAFYGCSGLTSITIPEGVTSIGSYAFYGCSNLKTVINYSDLTLQKGSSSNGYVAYYAEEVIDVVKVNGVTLNQATATLTEGESLTLTATIAPDNATDKTVAWSSSNMDIATVNEYGVVTAVAPGTATITAKAGGKEATCVVTVEPKVIAVGGLTLNQASATLTEGETLTLTATITPDNATDKTVTWSSSNTAIAIVDANGKVTAVAAGNATITATAGNMQATCVVTVKSKVVAVSGITLNQAAATLIEGETLTLTATVTPDNATDKTVTWSTSNAAVATVDEDGVVTAVAAGNATITATAGNMQATCVVTVKSKVVAVSGITLSQAAATLIEGESLTLTATITPDNATDKTVTWSTSDATVATVDANGKVTAVAAGTATITATAGDKTAVCVVTVTKKEDDNENEDKDENEDGDKEDEDAGIDSSTLNPQHSTEVYDLSGRRVLNTENLKGGVYIINGQKVVVK